MVLIGSCNLFSGSLNSGVLESALLIDDTKCAAEILEIVIQEKMVCEQSTKPIKANIDQDKQQKICIIHS